MLFGMAGAFFCYLAASVSMLPVFSLAACVLTGLCTSMLWPGTIAFVGEKFPAAGVAVYALMAAGGDAGASFAPQLVGIVADTVGASGFAANISQSLGMTAEQFGMRCAVLGASLFPLAGFFIILYMRKYFEKNKKGV